MYIACLYYTKLFWDCQEVLRKITIKSPSYG
nr:MAG TPA: hypothetical protein [Caudoviricetes sp.]